MPRPQRDQRGASLVEFALTVPVWLLVVLMIIEGSTLMFSRQFVAHEVAETSRALTLTGTTNDTDETILADLESELAPIPGLSIERFVIYRPVAEGIKPRLNCRRGRPSAASGSECNVYEAGAIHSFGCGAIDDDRFWCPADREPNDLVGVWIEAEYASLTGIFGSVGFEQHTTLFLEEETR